MENKNGVEVMDVLLLGEESSKNHVMLEFCVWSPTVGGSVNARCIYYRNEDSLALVSSSGDTAVDQHVLINQECLDDAREAMVAHRDELLDKLKTMN